MTCKSKTKAFFLNETFRLSFSIVLKSSLNKKVKHKGQSVGLCFYKCINYMANFPMLNRYSTTHAYNDEAQSEFSKILIINLWSSRASACCLFFVASKAWLITLTRTCPPWPSSGLEDSRGISSCCSVSFSASDKSSPFRGLCKGKKNRF